MHAQKLLDLIKANEDAPGFDINEVFVCDTYGCLWGNYLLSKDSETWRGRLFTGMSWYSPAKEFDIPYRIANWIFNNYDVYRKNNILYHGSYGDDEFHRDCTKEEAINRVRKYLYYKLHKKEMEEDKFGIKEEARRMGSWDLMDRVKKELVSC